MKKAIKEYLNKVLPESGIDTIHGKYYMRFELGGDLVNGTPERVDQVVTRAIEIYKQTIGTGQIIVAIEEFENELFDREGEYKDFLYDLIDENQLERIKGPFEQTYYEENEQGEKTEHVFEEKLDCDLLIGKLNVDINTIKQIIEGIGNLEMGIKPCIPQTVYFFSVDKETGFRIYDDRGCDVWANDKEQLRSVYLNLNEWILDYNRPEIDQMFN